MNHPVRSCLFMLIMFAISAVLASSPAAQESNSDRQFPWDLSEFEWRLVQRALERDDLSLLMPGEADGLTVDEIFVMPEEVFTDDDLWPNWLNTLHSTTKEDILRNDLLIEKGEPYSQVLVDESARYLRNKGLILSVALVLPVKGSSPDKVNLLIVTQDIWSLRLNQNFLFVDNTLSFLSLSLSENNFLGLHKQAALTSLLEQDTLTLGERYTDNGIFGSKVIFSESLSMILNRDSGALEGFGGGVSLGKPLVSRRSKWGWSAEVSGVTEIGRFFSGDQILSFDNPDTSAVSEELPFVWRTQALSASVGGVRSFGFDLKQNVSFGYSLSSRRFTYGEDDDDRASRDPVTVIAFEESILPRTEVVSSPFLSYRVFTPDTVELRNLNTYALPEAFRIGPSFKAGASHSDPALGSTSRFQTFNLSFTQRWLFGDSQDNPSRNSDILSFTAGHSTRFEDETFQDNESVLVLRNYSPVFLHGRLVNHAVMVYRTNDRSNQQSSLGPETGLRGYPTALFLGRSRLGANLEWRTLPVEFYALFFGGVLFYDMGGITNEEDWSELEVLHSAGVGIRNLTPASNRVVFRVDWGFPLNPPPGTGISTFPGTFAAGFSQAF